MYNIYPKPDKNNESVPIESEDDMLAIPAVIVAGLTAVVTLSSFLCQFKPEKNSRKYVIERFENRIEVHESNKPEIRIIGYGLEDLQAEVVKGYKFSPRGKLPIERFPTEEEKFIFRREATD